MELLSRKEPGKGFTGTRNTLSGSGRVPPRCDKCLFPEYPSPVPSPPTQLNNTFRLPRVKWTITHFPHSRATPGFAEAFRFPICQPLSDPEQFCNLCTCSMLEFLLILDFGSLNAIDFSGSRCFNNSESKVCSVEKPQSNQKVCEGVGETKEN